MTTTQRKSLRRNKKPPTLTPGPVLIDTEDATDEAAQFVYAVTAALGLELVEAIDAADDAVAANIQVIGNSLITGAQRWQYPEHEATFEHWLVSKCFTRPDHTTAWAVVQTGADPYPMLAPAMAYAVADQQALLVDADASATLTKTIQAATDDGIDALEFDVALPSPHIYLLNAPRWYQVTLLLQVNGANPLNTVLLHDTLAAAQHHFGHVVINCGADLFMAQRLAADGVQVIHVDDFSHPVNVKFQRYKQVNYFSHNMPVYATRRDFEFITTNTRRRASMRRWMQRGDT